MTVSTISSENSTTNPLDVFVYDSLYTTVDVQTHVLLKKLFGSDITVKMPVMQFQEGSTDCGLFAIAVVVALLYGVDPSARAYDQSQMRKHLITCLERQVFLMFP